MLLQYFLSANLKEGGSELLTKDSKANNLLEDSVVKNDQRFNDALNKSISQNKNIDLNQADKKDSSSSYFNLPLMQVDEIDASSIDKKSSTESAKGLPEDFSQLKAGDTLSKEIVTAEKDSTTDIETKTIDKTTKQSDGKQLPEQISQVGITQRTTTTPNSVFVEASEQQKQPQNTISQTTVNGESTKGQSGPGAQAGKVGVSVDNFLSDTPKPVQTSEQIRASLSTQTAELASNVPGDGNLKVAAESSEKADLVNKQKLVDAGKHNLANVQDPQVRPSISPQNDQAEVKTLNNMSDIAQRADGSSIKTEQIIAQSQSGDIKDAAKNQFEVAQNINNQNTIKTKQSDNIKTTAGLSSGRAVPANSGAIQSNIIAPDTDAAVANKADNAIQPERQIDSKAAIFAQKMGTDTGTVPRAVAENNLKMQKTIIPDQTTIKKQDIELKKPEQLNQLKADTVKAEMLTDADKPLQTRKLNTAALGIMSATASTQLYTSARADTSQVPLTYSQGTDSMQQNNNVAKSHLARDIALPVSMPRPQWNQRFAEHISMLTLKGASQARIRLDPPELGPMAVRIQTNGGETQIQFTVTNPTARELVDSGMQRLKDMLEEHGFAKVDVDVNEYQQQRQQAREEDDELSDLDLERHTDEASISTENRKPLATYQDSIGIVDIFA